MVKLSDIELPVVFKNQMLFKSGDWNHISFSSDMVDKSVSNTKWSTLNKRLYFKHENQYDISQWKGKVENIYSKQGEVRGDVEIWDANEAVQILHGKKPIALSADIEYNDSGVMFFTGFALEADPGVRNSEMFLSDAVKNELSGYFHAKFSNMVDTAIVEQKEQTQTNIINNQSAERGLNKQDAKMEETNKTSLVDNVPREMLSKVEAIEARLAVLEKEPTLVDSQNIVGAKTETKIEARTEITPITETKTAVREMPQAIPTVQTITETNAIDDRLVDKLVDKLAEKIKPTLMPTPMTINEFSGNIISKEEETVNRLAESLANN